MAQSNNVETEDFTPEKFQMLMFNLLGDRDYDCFEYDQHEQLKDKIKYSLYGQPILIEDSEDFNKLTDKEKNEFQKDEIRKNKQVERLYSIILKQNNLYSKYIDQVHIAFICVCETRLPEEIKKRLKKNKDYNAKTDFIPHPLYVLKKCENSLDPCRLFIDETGRVYENWFNYIENNTLPKCRMVLPKDGRYDGDDDNVKLEYHFSPACKISSVVLSKLDTTLTISGVAAGCVASTAFIPAIAIAPVAVTAATAAAACTGVYAIGRSAFNLIDKNRHKEDMSLANSEARSAYFGIVAGGLGFVGGGANIVIAKLAEKGVNIGKGAIYTANLIKILNLGANGMNMGNNVYDIIDQWLTDNKKPTKLTILQLTTSILFFGHAVYNFRFVGNIIDEKQIQILREYNDSLRSNRHKKMFDKLVKETIRQNDGNVQKGRTEVIKTLRNLGDKNDVFATLTRSNSLFNKSNVKFSASNGKIQLNGIDVDIANFDTLNKADFIEFLNNLPENIKPSIQNIEKYSNDVSIVIKNNTTDTQLIQYAPQIATFLWNAFGKYSNQDIEDKILNAFLDILKQFKLNEVINKLMDELFPNRSKYIELLQYIMSYFVELINQVEKNYELWQNSNCDEKYFHPEFLMLSLKKGVRLIAIFKLVTGPYFDDRNHLTEYGLRQLMKNMCQVFTKKVYDVMKIKESENKREEHDSQERNRFEERNVFQTKDCSLCGGKYYFNKN